MISDQDVAPRLLIAAGLACAIGFERDRLTWTADTELREWLRTLAQERRRSSGLRVARELTLLS